MPERKGPSGLSSEFFVGAPERDAITLVRDASKISLPKRFYENVGIAERDGAFAILLDGKPVRTPRQTPLSLPTRAAAELVAAEWAAQREHIDPFTMPATRLVNTALDGVAHEIEAVAADVVRYAGSDLTCYRAPDPPSLVVAQATAWNPVLAFVADQYGARMIVAEGIVHAAQTPEALAAIRHKVDAIVADRDAAFRVAALHVVTTLTGSALIALAVYDGALSRDAAWMAAHVDEDEQMRVWGLDSEALRRRAARFEDMKAACALLSALA